MYTHTHCVMLTVLQCERRVIFFWAFATFFPGICNLFSGHTQPFFRAFATFFPGIRICFFRAFATFFQAFATFCFFRAFATFFPGIHNLFRTTALLAHGLRKGAGRGGANLKHRLCGEWDSNSMYRSHFQLLLKQIFVHFAQTPWRNFFWGGNGTR